MLTTWIQAVYQFFMGRSFKDTTSGRFLFWCVTAYYFTDSHRNLFYDKNKIFAGSSFGDMVRALTGKKKEDGSLSTFQTLIVSTATRVGMGNLVGVVAAVSAGGAGAVFWMWITAIIGGATAFIESTLAQIYKKRADDGTCYGGPAFYMQHALKQRWLGVIFSVLIILIYAVGYNMLAAYNLQSAFAVFDFYDAGVRLRSSD